MVKTVTPIIQHEEFAYPGPFFAQRISELAGLQQGWATEDPGNPEGEPITPEIFESMYALLNALSSDFEIPNPAVGASIEGGIQLMWHRRGVVCEIDQDRIVIFQNFTGHMDIQEYSRNADGIHQATSQIKEHMRL